MIVALGLLTACGTSGVAQISSEQQAVAAPNVSPSSTATNPDGSSTPSPSTSPTSPPSTQVAAPIGIRIPAIDVEATMLPLGLKNDGSIEVPSDFSQTGWWADGPEPGEVGPAVILGHVDSRQGPAVFYDLRRLQPGDTVQIDRVDGSAVTYAVDRVEKHPKNAFPTETVYGPTPEPVLRLVTCGGDFDRDARSYKDNVIVFANLVEDSSSSNSAPASS
ncbi:MAG: class F sortase [Acidimicrobiales bacterium]